MTVGFFTHGIEFTLPHPKIPQRTILLLCMVIERAWQIIVKTPPAGFHLHSANEDTITQVLVEIIENRLRKIGEVDGFDYARFGRVSRAPKITNFDKKHPDKMPDIVFDLKREHSLLLNDQDGLFVECKPIDSKHSIWSCYCKKGLDRFINGDYAWAMQDALMVGYANDQPSFKKLVSVLDNTEKSATLKTINHSALDKYMIYKSKHKREFGWLQNRGTACPISVAHLWLPL
jgi:hypothetical protein